MKSLTSILNGYVWVEGIVADNLRYNQRKIVKYNHLVANMLIFHTMACQTKAINELCPEGMDTPDEVLAGFSPYWRDHLSIFD